MQVRIIRIALLRAVEKARCLRPILLLDRLLAGCIVRVARSEIRIRLGRIGGDD